MVGQLIGVLPYQVDKQRHPVRAEADLEPVPCRPFDLHHPKPRVRQPGGVLGLAEEPG